ncbi:MAG: hypothetical protein HC892_11375 [Saprospiraceae bacterium]|nr:hypothetical protein [Saprospiraceae bacterium]
MKQLMFLSLISLGIMFMSFPSTGSSFDSQNYVTAYNESDPAKDYLPSFPIVVYENILFGKGEIDDEAHEDKCSSKKEDAQPRAIILAVNVPADPMDVHALILHLMAVAVQDL